MHQQPRWGPDQSREIGHLAAGFRGKAKFQALLFKVLGVVKPGDGKWADIGIQKSFEVITGLGPDRSQCAPARQLMLNADRGL